ncbi:hypothetical protein [Lysobacter gummosus]
MAQKRHKLLAINFSPRSYRRAAAVSSAITCCTAILVTSST